jgi:hypothetical protein
MADTMPAVNKISTRQIIYSGLLPGILSIIIFSVSGRGAVLLLLKLNSGGIFNAAVVSLGLIITVFSRREGLSSVSNLRAQFSPGAGTINLVLQLKHFAFCLAMAISTSNVAPHPGHRNLIFIRSSSFVVHPGRFQSEPHSLPRHQKKRALSHTCLGTAKHPTQNVKKRPKGANLPHRFFALNLAVLDLKRAESQ